MKQTARLENWVDYGVVYTGYVFDHPRYPDGSFVQTSTVVERCEGGVETVNTFYTLGAKYVPPLAGNIYAEVKNESDAES